MKNYCLSQIQNQVSNLCFVWKWKKKKKGLLRNWADKTGMGEEGLRSQGKCQEPSGGPPAPRGTWALPPARPLPTQQQLEQSLAAVLTRMLSHKQQIN